MSNSAVTLFAASALLPEGWGENVLIEIEDGLIQSVKVHELPGSAQCVEGAVVPGMPNLHSHAFQRAMAGLTERAGPSGDNFWAWRELMYRFLERITPEDSEAIAAQLYIEMLKAGYTSVAEFHYLHHDHDGQPYADPNEMAWRIVAAAQRAGIGLTVLPVFYAHATFGGAPPHSGQKRFVQTLDSYNASVEALIKKRDTGMLRRVGIAPHSLRAVTPPELQAVTTAFHALDNTAPIHIHAAEQIKEVDDCLAWSQQRPVAWLLDHASLDTRWCVVHATHLDSNEIFRLVRSGAVAGLCPTTEANLGDGIFNAGDYFMQGRGNGEMGKWGIGGDSHVGAGPFEELKLIEYAQRLRHMRRNILTTPHCASIGGGLYRQALDGGTQALGQRIGAIRPGCHADLLVLNGDDPALAERHGDDLLDAAIFAPAQRPVRDVMVQGRWVVQDGRHAEEEKVFQTYRQTLRKLMN